MLDAPEHELALHPPPPPSGFWLQVEQGTQRLVGKATASTSLGLVSPQGKPGPFDSPL